MRLLGGKGPDQPLNDDEKRAVQGVLELYAHVRWELLMSKHAPELILAIGLAAPIAARLAIKQNNVNADPATKAAA